MTTYTLECFRDLVVTHGTAGVELGRARYVPHGTWRRVWEILEGQLSVKRAPVQHD